MRRAPAAGLSLVEVLFAVSVAMAAAGVAVPAMLEMNRALRLRGAAGFIAGYLQHARAQALHRSAAVGLRFREHGSDWMVAAFVDGNGNGIRTAEIASGVDAMLDEETAMSARCPAVRIARLADVPDVNGVSGGAAVRFGASAIATFDADGSASSGSLYLTDGRTQIAVTLTPATGRVRLRRWQPATRTWELMR